MWVTEWKWDSFQSENTSIKANEVNHMDAKSVLTEYFRVLMYRYF